MAYSISKLGTLALKTQSAWGTAESSFASTDLLEVGAPVVPPLSREALTTDTYRADFTQPTVVAGSKAPTEISISGPLHGWSATTPTGNASSFPDALLISRALGSITSGTAYTTSLTSGGSTTIAKYTDGAASITWESFAQLLPISGGRAIAWIADIDTTANPDTGTYAAAITAAHSSSGTAYGSILAYLSASYDLSPLTLQWLGSNASDQIRFFDAGVTKVRLVFERKKQPMMEATLRAHDWTNVGSGGAPTPASYTYPQMPAVTGTNGARLYINGTAISTWHSVIVEITQDLPEVPNGGGNQGLAQFVATNRRVTIEVKLAPSNLSATSGAPGDTPGVLQLDANTTPGRACSVFVGAPVLLEQPTIEDAGGILIERRLYGCGIYTADDANGTASDTAFRVAFL